MPGVACNDSVMHFGEAVRRARENAGISQEELANRLGVSLRTVGNWERGATDPDTAPVIVEAYQRAIAGEGGHRISRLLAAHGMNLTERGARYYLDSGFPAGLLHIHDPACRCGRVCMRRVHIPGGHPAIVGDDVWRKSSASGSCSYRTVTVAVV